jgi:hypothetical protein
MIHQRDGSLHHEDVVDNSPYCYRDQIERLVLHNGADFDDNMVDGDDYADYDDIQSTPSVLVGNFVALHHCIQSYCYGWSYSGHYCGEVALGNHM